MGSRYPNELHSRKVMECQDSGLSVGSSGVLQLDTIRALHQTVVSLRSALENSKSELNQLREKYQSHPDCSLYEDTIQKLTLENHLLRRKIINSNDLQIEISKESDTVNIGLLSDYDLLRSSTSLIVSNAEDEHHLKQLDLPEVVIEESSAFEDNIEITCSPLNIDYDKINIQLETDNLEENKITLNENIDRFSTSYYENQTFCGTIEFDESSTTDSQNEGEYHVNLEENISHEITVDPNLSRSDYVTENTDVEDLILSATEDIGGKRFHSRKKNDYKTKIELESKFDVTIRVCASKSGRNIFSSTTSETDSMEGGKGNDKNLSKDKCSDKQFSQPDSQPKKTNKVSSSKEHVTANQEEVKAENKVVVNTLSSDTVAMAVPSNSENSVNKVKDEFNVEVRITSEDNLSVNTKGLSKHSDSLNLEVDELSLRSVSERENSVCSEDVPTSVEVNSQAETESKESKMYEQDNISNDSEEVDDIELIFTTDESKDVTGLQEDLVSITDADHNWSNVGNATPVLLKFNALDPETHDDTPSVTENTDNVENENQENMSTQTIYADTNVQSESNLKSSDQSLGQDVATNTTRSGILKHVHSDIQFDRIHKEQKSVDDAEFYNNNYSRTLSFENNTNTSSFDRSSTLDYNSREFSLEHRDESIDQFDMKDYPMTSGVRYSLFAETDISKCGISEEDITQANLNSRRNTCPNPFQYRPIPHRSAMRGPTRAPHVAYKVVGRARPVLYTDPLAMRRENAAQTVVSALPDRWSSDGYLAHRAGLSRLTTLPGRMSRPQSRPVYGAAPAPFPHSRLTPHAHTDEARRNMLSDIGFTSMVPELSRSADPLWCVGCSPTTGVTPVTCLSCGRRASVPTSPTRLPDPIDKYLSQGPSQSGPSGTSNNRRWTDSWHLSRSYSKKPNLDKRSSWRNSLPELRPVALDSGDSTEELLDEAERFLRRSIDNLHDRDSKHLDGEEWRAAGTSRPYLPAEPRHLRLGHMVKVITPHGRIVVGKVRYVGLAGGAMQVGVQVCHGAAGLPHNDGTLQGRRYFRTDAAYTALFVPFAKVVMAWPA